MIYVHILHEGSIDKIFVYVDDLFITSKGEDTLQTIADELGAKYPTVTVKTGLQHDFLEIHWDFGTKGQASLSSIVVKHRTVPN